MSDGERRAQPVDGRRLGGQLPPLAPPVRSAEPAGEAEQTGERAQTVLEQLGGISGLVYSTVPVVVFVPVNSFFGLQAAIWAALAVAGAILLWRVVGREPLQPAISGFLGVGICALIAHRTGEAKGFFLFGIYTSLVYGGVLLGSTVLRWPLVGVAWGFLNGHGNAWRADKRAMHSYDIATLAWVAVFAARFVVQKWLYDSDETDWLAVARIGMGWPLTIVALLVTVWAVRRAGHTPVKPATPQR